MSRPLMIFDIDGTLIDSRTIISQAMARAFEKCDLAEPSYDQTRQIVGLSLMEALNRLAPQDIDHAGLLDLGEAYKNAFIDLRKSTADLEPFYDGALALLDFCREQDWAIGVATGKSRRGLDALIEKRGLASYFDAHYCADDGPGKPDPFMVQANLDALAISPTRSVMIGDTSFDMIMARAANVQAVGVNWGFHTEAEIKAGGAHHIVDTMDALRAVLSQFEGRLVA